MENKPETALIEIEQPPIIVERLHLLKEKWEKSSEDAEAMVCTEETVQACKAARAELNKEFDILEEKRKAVKQAILEPYNAFEAVYKECVTEPRNRAISSYSTKINEVEAEQKRRCEEGLRDYFAELCVVHHLDWLEYERAGIKVDMASAKAKTPAKLRKQLMEFVVSIAESVERVSALDDANEIMVEFKRTLNATDAICTVQERHRRIEEQRKAQETRAAAVQQEAEAVRRVEALAPPVQAEPQKTVKCTFTVRTTMDKLKKLKEFLETEGIQYE